MPVTAGETRVALPDVVLRDTMDTPFRLRPESFGGRIVVINFIFTNCTTVCPALTMVMNSVQRELGDRLGKDVVLLSISVDPARDTPQVMRDYAQRVGAGENWLWLTGATGDIARVLRAFGLSAGNPNDHPPLILVGDPVRDSWQRWVGMPTPATVVENANAMLLASRDASTNSSVGVEDSHGHH